MQAKIQNQVSELKLQKAVHKLLSDPSEIRYTQSGKRLQVLSPGQINVYEGPDYKEIAILQQGMVIIGDAEFHRKSSDWYLHNHHSDENYNSVVLHIIFDEDVNIDGRYFETLKLEKESVDIIARDIENNPVPKTDIDSLETLQHYALLRLLRKTSESQKLLNQSNLEKTLMSLSLEYIKKYYQRKKRPVYTLGMLDELLSQIPGSEAYYFLDEMMSGKKIHIPDRMQTLIKKKIANEGAHLRRELILNCILPLSICLANEEARISLFLWYWSTPALHHYGVLSRRFKTLPQNFLWQQQGMLEYLREHGRKPNIISEAIKEYGFAEILSFYRLGRAPFNDLFTDS